MIEFINGLFIDLRNRIDKMVTRLNNLSMESSVASTFKSKTIDLLNELQKRIVNFINSGVLDYEFFISNNIREYNSINNEFLEIELFRYHPISKYDSRAYGHFEKVIKRIYDEIRCTQTIPFISTISDSATYYWAYPKYNMIALPQDEEEYLLNLSDIFHEIGHLIYQQSEKYLVSNHTGYLSNFYSSERQRLRDEETSHDNINDLVLAEKCWNSGWTEEFTCDLIATYLVGPAYGWTNMKICTISSGDNAVYSEEYLFRQHPPDESRMRVIFKMLETLGFNTELQEIKNAWNKFLDETKNTKPRSYDFIFTDNLIESITKNVFEACRNLALRSYSDQLKLKSPPVAQVINDAWTKIRTDPQGFQAWESLEISKLIK